jgi:hypothetical protein
MPDIGIQFLAVPEEMEEFFAQCALEFGLHVVKVTFPPYHAEEIHGDSLVGLFSYSPKSFNEDVVFTKEPPFRLNTFKDIHREMPDSLRLNIGKSTKDRLEECFLSARTDDMQAYTVWKKIAKKLKAITSKGAIATNPDTGARGPAKSHRFTKGAIKAHNEGVQLVTGTGIELTPTSVLDGESTGCGE